jgi:hypothetical protein
LLGEARGDGCSVSSDPQQGYCPSSKRWGVSSKLTVRVGGSDPNMAPLLFALTAESSTPRLYGILFSHCQPGPLSVPRGLPQILVTWMMRGGTTPVTPKGRGPGWSLQDA